MSPAETAAALRAAADDPEVLTALHLHLEDELVRMRDACLIVTNEGGRLPANGLVIKSVDGDPSSIIRIGTRTAVRMVLQALADRLDA